MKQGCGNDTEFFGIQLEIRVSIGWLRVRLLTSSNSADKSNTKLDSAPRMSGIVGDVDVSVDSVPIFDPFFVFWLTPSIRRLRPKETVTS